MRNRVLSLLLTAVLLFTAVVPVYAAEMEPSGGTNAEAAAFSQDKENSEDQEDSEDKEEAEEGDESEDAETPPENEEAPAETAPDPWGGLAPPKSDDETDPETPENPEDSNEGEIVAGVSLVTDRHIAYALGDGKAMASFNPWQKVTRSVAAQFLYRLLPGNAPVSNVQFTDVPSTSWCYAAASAMATLGVMRPGEAEFRPDDELTRGEFIRYLASFFPLRSDAQQFPDVPADSPNAPFIRSARAYGWTQGDKDGLFNPDNTITRYEVVVMINRALGRSADREYIARTHPTFYIDVSPETWFYYDIIEASVYHEHTGTGAAERWTSHTAKQNVPAEGFQLVNGWLFYYDSAKGDVARNMTVQNHIFDTNGHFTTGNAELDGKLRSIVMNKTNSGMTQEQKLRALFVYTRDSFTYLRRPAYAFGATDFMVTDALRILNTGYGNCYCYASLFWFLSRWIGYDSRIFSGTVGQNRAPHSWVEITMDGQSYIFDTELEMAYRRKGRYDVNLYKFYDSRNSWRYVRP